ncbi:MAG: acetylxylan esterase [Methanotrichaceae archaeon]
MEKYRIIAALLIIGFIIAIAISVLSLSDSRQEWHVSSDGILEYSLSTPEYQLAPLNAENNTTLYDVEFTSRDTQISALLRMPGQLKDANVKSVPGIVLLPGATVTKEREQGLAKYLCSLGYASITIDQRNLGGIDMDGDLQMFQKGQEPTENKMVYDALAAAEILRSRPEIDPSRIIYAGESNGARFAIIACALDPKARGVIAISTSGFGVDQAIASGMLTDPEMIRFYKSIDPETYLAKIPPRKLVMMHSQKDPIIPYEQGLELFSKAFEPKTFYTVNCSVHGHCAEMDPFIEKELKNMSS